MRDLGSLATRVLEGTRGASQPFFSPDGHWIGFFRDNALMRVAVSGGAPIAVCPTRGATYGGSWGPDDRIVFATDSGLYYDMRDVSKSLKELLDEIKKNPGKVGVTVKLF